MVRTQEFHRITRSSDRSTLELFCVGAVALGAILLIAASSLSFEGRPVQPMDDGQAVPLHVVSNAG